ncbi:MULTISPECIES: hypothetical protein [Paenibacillus]|nr:MULTISPECIES: hypothetical protein [Paenibacillus]
MDTVMRGGTSSAFFALVDEQVSEQVREYIIQPDGFDLQFAAK